MEDTNTFRLEQSNEIFVTLNKKLNKKHARICVLGLQGILRKHGKSDRVDNVYAYRIQTLVQQDV